MKLITKENEYEIAELVSEKFISLIRNKPTAVLGLATGSTPIPCYRKIIERAKKYNIDFSCVTSFNLDEYVGNPDYMQSYRYFMDVNLFDQINIDKSHTYFPDEKHPENYDGDIQFFGGIDLQILGIGANGHIGFNEPNTPFNSKTHIVNLSEKTISDNARFFKSINDVPTKAVTMGLATIMQAKEIILIATGRNKAQAIKRMFEAPNESCPASILNRHSNVTIYCDKEATKLL